MPRAKKTVEPTVSEPTSYPLENVSKPLLELNLELGRQDLNDNFRKIQDAINQLMK